MNLSGMDLNLLVALDALVRHRNVTRAGREIGLSQPAMSNALARLRGVLDDPVLVRGARGMEPTPHAVQLAGHVGRALGEIRCALARGAAFDPAVSDTQFRVAVTDHTGLVLIPSLMKALRKEAPRVRLDLRAWQGEPTLAELERGDFDLAIGIATHRLPSALHRKELLQDGFVCLIRKGHPLVKKRLTLARYVELCHILVAPHGGLRGLVDDHLEAIGLERRVVLSVPHFAAAPFIVVETDLVVTLSKWVAHPFTKLLPLSAHPTPLPIEGHPWSMFWHERTHTDPARRWLRELVHRVAEGLSC